MYIVSGYVVVAVPVEEPSMRIIIGPPGVEAPNKGWETLPSNGLRVFGSVELARQVSVQLPRYFKYRPRIKHLYIEAAENQEDLRLLRASRSLVLLLLEKGGDPTSTVTIYGPHKNGTVLQSDRLSVLQECGIRTFHSFKRADYAASELSRQSGGCVSLASWIMLQV